MGTFERGEVSTEILVRDFLKQILVDPVVSPVVARYLAQQDIETRGRIVVKMAMDTGVHRSFWDEQIKNLK